MKKAIKSSRPPVNYLTYEEFLKLPQKLRDDPRKLSKLSPDAVRAEVGIVSQIPLPCPFCGGSAKVSRHKEHPPELEEVYWSTQCADKRRICTAQAIAFGDSRSGAIINWNTRNGVVS